MKKSFDNYSTTEVIEMLFWEDNVVTAVDIAKELTDRHKLYVKETSELYEINEQLKKDNEKLSGIRPLDAFGIRPLDSNKELDENLLRRTPAPRIEGLDEKIEDIVKLYAVGLKLGLSKGSDEPYENDKFNGTVITKSYLENNVPSREEHEALKTQVADIIELMKDNNQTLAPIIVELQEKVAELEEKK